MSTSGNIKIAQDLHDGIAQDLVALGYQIDLLISQDGSDPQIRIGLRTVRFGIDDLISKVRREIFSLRQGEQQSLSKRIAQSGIEICGARLGDCDLQDVYGSLHLEDELFMIACELLRNASKHSGASAIGITLSQNQNRLYLEVFDNGMGGAHVSDERFGLKGISEKVAAAKGVLRLISNERGTRAQVTL